MQRTQALVVRPAKQDDVVDVAVLVRMLAKETGVFKLFGFSMAKTIALLERMVANESGIFMLAVADDDGEICGFMAACKSQALFSECVQATELGWYVCPEYRKSSIAVRLHKMYEEWAEAHDVNVISMMHMNTEDSERIGKMYEKMGYTKTETAYSKETN